MDKNKQYLNRDRQKGRVTTLWSLEGSTVSFEDLKLMLKSNLQENRRLGRSWEGTGRWEEQEPRQGGEKPGRDLGESAWPVLLQGTGEAPHLSALSLLSEAALSELLPCLGLFYSSPFLSFPLCLPAQRTQAQSEGASQRKWSLFFKILGPPVSRAHDQNPWEECVSRRPQWLGRHATESKIKVSEICSALFVFSFLSSVWTTLVNNVLL